ncbi:MAG: helix-turn-helix transcriptional regulator [Clostridia bacterium]|nr:helix-turn-helix transcriptional regulator [Clostridia bacterium]
MKMENIGEKIRDLRKNKNLTQEELAEKLGVSAQAVSKWEIGLSAPDISLLLPLCDALGTGADALLGGNRKNELEEQFQKAIRYGEEATLRVSEEALKDFPDDEKWLFRRAHDEYVLAIERKLDFYLRPATIHYRELHRKFPDKDIYKSGLAELLFVQGKKDESFVLAYECKENDQLLKKILEGEELEKHKRAVLNKKFNTFLFELFDYNTLESLELAEKLLNIFSCEYRLWQVYAHRAKIYFAEKDYENFNFCKKEAEHLADLADEKYPAVFEVSASEQLHTWEFMSNDLRKS